MPSVAQRPHWLAMSISCSSSWAPGSQPLPRFMRAALDLERRRIADPTARRRIASRQEALATALRIGVDHAHDLAARRAAAPRRAPRPWCAARHRLAADDRTSPERRRQLPRQRRRCHRWSRHRRPARRSAAPSPDAVVLAQRDRPPAAPITLASLEAAHHHRHRRELDRLSALPAPRIAARITCQPRQAR